ncbi:hypothetical protein E6O75_ATG05731 [Venturia nashicola]|uniref:Uncharacterized protein n=1 Tax=Venturia nashicola TaxID=86259 RepID=A0A4Z1P8E6_9PEZI|nr:hypothetical protein E6O75_ATG05731 [Venturia nashicola]
MAPFTRQRKKDAIYRWHIKEKAPTNFLSLPIELRHQILIHSIPYNIGLVAYYYCHCNCQKRYNRCQEQTYKDHCRQHAKNLCQADPSGRVMKDMKYVQKRWEEEAAHVRDASMKEDSQSDSGLEGGEGRKGIQPGLEHKPLPAVSRHLT